MTTNPVVSAILGVSSDNEVRAAMLMGSWFESSWNENATESGGGGGEGAFQLSPGGPTHTSAQAFSPSASASIMLSAYEAAVKSIPQSLWTSNPEMAAEEAAVAAEKPQQSYLSSYGQNAVNTAWSNTESALGGNSTFTSSGDSSTQTSPGGIAGDLESLGVTSLSGTVERLGLIVLGAILILVGIWKMVGSGVSGSPAQAHKTGAATASSTATEVAQETAEAAA